MNGDRNVLYARICLLASGILLAAVLLAGGLRCASEREPGLRTATREPPALAAFSADRAELRREELRQLEVIADDETASQAIRDEARRRRMELMRWMELEATLADVLSARGFEAPVITVHGDSANVLVRAESLSREEAAVILELVTRETGITGGNVKIVPIN